MEAPAVEVFKRSDLQIWTPEGWSDFEGVRVTSEPKSHLLTFSDGSTLECTSRHKIKMAGNVFVIADNIFPNEMTYEGLLVSDNQRIHGTQKFYDALEVKKGNQYYTNSVISHNCEFIGSSDTLLSPEALAAMRYVQPLRKNNNIAIFVDPERGHQYVLVADVARGGGNDYSAFVVVDVTSFPYIVVATYRDNNVAPVVYPNFIDQASRIYNNANILVEVNDIGGQIADILHNDLENEGLLMVTQNIKKGQTLGGGFAKNSRFGLKTTPAVKRIGCFAIKGLVEKSQLVTNDFEILNEFSTFVHDGVNYGAEFGKHDDLVMCLVLFGWATTQKYFKELLDSDVRIRILEENERQIEEDMIPFGFIDDGVTDPYGEEVFLA